MSISKRVVRALALAMSLSRSATSRVLLPWPLFALQVWMIRTDPIAGVAARSESADSGWRRCVAQGKPL
jgi:hypothetical protein